MTMKSFGLGLTVGLALMSVVVRGGAQATNISTSGTLPTNCTVGNVYVKTGASAGFYVCLATDTWTNVSGSGGGALSALTAATGANTIASGNNHSQLWNWALTTNTISAMKFGETTAATSGTADGQSIVAVNTLASSTAVPLIVNNFGASSSFVVNDVASDTTPFTISDAGDVGVHGVATSGYDLTIHPQGAGKSILITDGTVSTLHDNDWDSLCKSCLGTTSAHTFGFFANNTTAAYFTTGQTFVLNKTPGSTLTNANAAMILGTTGATQNDYRSICAGYRPTNTYSPVCFGYIQTGANSGNTQGAFFVSTRNATTDTASTEKLRIDADGSTTLDTLKTTGAATGKKVVCVDTANGKIYASSTGTDCSN